MDQFEKQVIIEAIKAIDGISLVTRSEYRTPHHPVRFNCDNHPMRHPAWKMGPQAAINESEAGRHPCPLCASLAESETISFADLQAGYKAQSATLKKSAEKAKSKARRRGGAQVRYSV